MTTTVQLPEVLDIRAASPLTAQLLAARGKQLTIDASNVQQIGAQCVQVLLSAKATWSADGAPLTIADPSDTFVEALQTLGIPLAKFSEQDASK